MPWACTACTFINEGGVAAVACAVCGTVVPLPVAAEAAEQADAAAAAAAAAAACADAAYAEALQLLAGQPSSTAAASGTGTGTSGGTGGGADAGGVARGAPLLRVGQRLQSPNSADVGDRVDVLELVGRGGFGEVAKVRWPREWSLPPRVCAAKVARPGRSKQAAHLREARTLYTELPLHKNVVTMMYAFVAAAGELVLVMELAEYGSARDGAAAVRRLCETRGGAVGGGVVSGAVDGHDRVGGDLQLDDGTMTFREWVFHEMKMPRGGPMTYVEWVLDAAIQLARGLVHVHAHGMVHQDVSPANTLLFLMKPGGGHFVCFDPVLEADNYAFFGAERGDCAYSAGALPPLGATFNAVKLADFGLSDGALLRGEGAAGGGGGAAAGGGGSGCEGEGGGEGGGNGAATGARAPTHGWNRCYRSPEQARGDASLSGATDVWSWAATVCHLLAGGCELAPVWALGERACADAATVPALASRDGLRALLAECLVEDPALRPSAAECVARAEALFADEWGRPYFRAPAPPAEPRSELERVRGRADMLRELGEFAEAEALYRRALELDPRDHLTLNNLSRFLATEFGGGARMEEALLLQIQVVQHRVDRGYDRSLLDPDGPPLDGRENVSQRLADAERLAHCAERLSAHLSSPDDPQWWGLPDLSDSKMLARALQDPDKQAEFSQQ